MLQISFSKMALAPHHLLQTKNITVNHATLDCFSAALIGTRVPGLAIGFSGWGQSLTII